MRMRRVLSVLPKCEQEAFSSLVNPAGPPHYFRERIESCRYFISLQNNRQIPWNLTAPGRRCAYIIQRTASGVTANAAMPVRDAVGKPTATSLIKIEGRYILHFFRRCL